MEEALLPRAEEPRKSVGIAFENVEYVLSKGKQNERKILHGVSGAVPAGKVTALFGPTGSGKTTLLDVIAGRKERRRVFGKILVNGKRVKARVFSSIAGYVVQDDTLMGNLTCRENIMFSARLRLSYDLAEVERKSIVEEVINSLGLGKCADTLVGDDFVRGLSGGERKRTSIGCELVIQPQILLLDEPSSGLDARTALDVVEQLGKLAANGTTVLMSIHQPRYSIFKLLDHVVLLSRGEIVYSGSSSNVVSYFDSVGYTCESFNNPADFLLDVLTGIVPRQRTGQNADPSATLERLTANELADGAHEALLQAWKERSIAELETGSADQIFDEDWEISAPIRPGFWRQFVILSRKTLLGLSRLPQVVVMQLCTMVFFGVVTGGLYYKLDYSQNGLQNRLGAFFFLIMSMVFGNLNGIELFLKERALFIHQRSNHYYDTGPYFFAMLACDLVPMRIFPMIVYCAIVYPMMGFQPHWENFSWFMLTLIVEAICSGTLCYCMSAAIGVFAIANLAVSVVYVMSMIFGGLLVSLNSLPSFLSWIQYLSFFKYGYESLAITELHGLEFEVKFGPVKMKQSGDDILKMRGFDLDNRSTDLLAMVLLSICFGFLSYQALNRLTLR